jgi:hypothetical protein
LSSSSEARAAVLFESAVSACTAERISQFLFLLPINDKATCLAFSSTPVKASASCRNRFSTSSYREKLARTNLPLMGSIIFTAPLFPRF